MAVKYRIEYTSVNDIDYQCDLSIDSHVGAITTLEGNVEYGLNSVDDLSHPIRSKYLRITVGATLTVPLTDLFTANERDWKVEFYRDGNKIFFGYLTSEDTPQSFVEDSWDVELDALDPMAFLEDLAYVDLLGAKYNGLEQVAKVIANCLKRGFADQNDAFNILSYEHFDYRTQSPIDNSYTEYSTGRLLKDTAIDQDIYIDDDSNESESCQKVLTEVLKSLQLTVTQINGDTWLIGHYLFDQSTVVAPYINSYDKDGNDIADLSLTPYSEVPIKTDGLTVADTDVVHINENQDYYHKRGLQKLVTNFEYRYKKSQLENPSFDGGVNLGTMPDWVLDADFAESTDQGHVKIFRYDSGVSADDFAMRSDSEVYVARNERLKLKAVVYANFDNPIFKFNIKYTVAGDPTPKYMSFIGDSLNPVIGWEDETVIADLGRSMGFERDTETTLEYELPETLQFGTLEVYVYACYPTTTSNTTDFIEVRELDLIPNDENVSGLSAVRTNTATTSLKSDKDEIFLNTSRASVLGNHLYKWNLGNPPIAEIKDNGQAGNYGVLTGIHTSNRLRVNKLRKIFTGDFLNFFEPHKYVTIPDLDSSQYIVLEYSFDTASNIGNGKYEERDIANVASTFSETKIYKETIEPKIE